MDAPVETGITSNGEGPGNATALVGGCALVFGIGNSLVIAALPGTGPDTEVVVFFAIAWSGVIGAQGALHAIWCVLAPVAGRIRLVVGVAVAVFWYGALFFGIALAAGIEDDFWDVALIGLLCLPLITLGIQAPLWLVRFLFRWRIVRADDDSVGSRMTTLRIRHIMLGTAGIALALGAARLAKPEDVDTEAVFLLAMFIPVLVLMLVSAGTTLPLLLATLRARRLRFSLSIVFSVFLAIEVMCFLSIALFLPVPQSLVAGLAMAGVVGALIGGYLVGLIGVLLIARSFGYRLQWGRRTDRTEAQPDSEEEATEMEE
jgi:hypothetical protein